MLLHILCIVTLIGWTVGCSSNSSSDDSDNKTVQSDQIIDYQDTQLESRLDTVLQTYVESYALNGAAIKIVSPDNIDYLNSAGIFNLEDSSTFEDDSYVRIGSSTKPVTAAVILQLIEEGKLSLDSTLAEFVSDYPNGDAITVEHLLRHRSGIHEIQLDDMKFVTYAILNNEKWLTPYEILSWTYGDDPIQSMTEDKMVPRGPVADPGEVFHYSQPGFIALGLIIEQITGKDLADVFEERVFAPLNMTNTHLPVKDDPHDPVGYTNLFGMQKDTVPTTTIVSSLNSVNSSAWCAGGLVSTAGDLFKLLYGLLNGELLSETSLADLQDWMVSSPEGYGLNTKAEYGMGFSRTTRDAYISIGHNGSAPGSGSVMQYIEAYDVYILAVRNTDPAKVEEGTPDLIELVKMALFDELE